MTYKKQKSQNGLQWWLNRKTNKGVSIGKRASWFKKRWVVDEFHYNGSTIRTRYFNTKPSAMKTIQKIVRG